MSRNRRSKGKHKDGDAPKPLTPQQETLNRQIMQQFNVFAEKEAASMGFIQGTGTECLWGVLMDAKAGRSDKDSFQWFERMVNKYECEPEELAKLYELIHSRLPLYDRLMDTECERLGI